MITSNRRQKSPGFAPTSADRLDDPATLESRAASFSARAQGDELRGIMSGGGRDDAGAAPVQARFSDPTQLQADEVRSVATEGVKGSGGKLPHYETIQKAFGDVDLTGVEAHVGGSAAKASQKIGAAAYATGNKIAFKESPDLHTAAHEATHVLQQRHGVELPGGVGRSGDIYERNANRVADRVVAGGTAHDLLPGREGGAHNYQQPAVQNRDEVQREENPSTDGKKLLPSFELHQEHEAVLLGDPFEADISMNLCEVVDGDVSECTSQENSTLLEEGVVDWIFDYSDAESIPRCRYVMISTDSQGTASLYFQAIRPGTIALDTISGYLSKEGNGEPEVFRGPTVTVDVQAPDTSPQMQFAQVITPDGQPRLSGKDENDSLVLLAGDEVCLFQLVKHIRNPGETELIYDADLFEMVEEPTWTGGAEDGLVALSNFRAVLRAKKDGVSEISVRAEAFKNAPERIEFSFGSFQSLLHENLPSLAMLKAMEVNAFLTRWMDIETAARGLFDATADTIGWEKRAKAILEQLVLTGLLGGLGGVVQTVVGNMVSSAGKEAIGMAKVAIESAAADASKELAAGVASEANILGGCKLSRSTYSAVFCAAGTESRIAVGDALKGIIDKLELHIRGEESLSLVDVSQIGRDVDRILNGNSELSIGSVKEEMEAGWQLVLEEQERREMASTKREAENPWSWTRSGAK